MKNLPRFYTRLENLLYYELSPLYDVVSSLVSLGQWDRWRKLSLPHVVGARVLEVGFGTGILLAELTRRGYSVFGLDLSPAMHRIAAARLARQSLRAKQIRGAVQSLPLAPHSFDTVISTFLPPSFWNGKRSRRLPASSLLTVVLFSWTWFSLPTAGSCNASRADWEF